VVVQLLARVLMAMGKETPAHLAYFHIGELQENHASELA